MADIDLAISQPIINVDITVPTNSVDLTITGVSPKWGSINGTLSTQTDLQTALDAKLSLTGGTMTGSLTVNNQIFTTYSGTLSTGTDSTYAVRIGQDTGRIALGANASGNFIQSFGTRPLVFNSVGNNSFFFGKIGIAAVATTLVAPTHSLTLLSTADGIAQYNTSDTVTNYERARGFWSGSVYNLLTEAGGTGTIRGIKLTTVNNFNVSVNAASTSGIVSIGGSSGLASGIGLFVNTTSTASSGISYGSSISPIINQSGTGGYTALLVNPTETATGSGSKFLLDLAVNSSSRFSVSSAGVASLGGGLTVGSLGGTSSMSINYRSATIFSDGLTIRKRGTTGDDSAALTSNTEIGYHSFSGWTGTTNKRLAYVIVRAKGATSDIAGGGSYKINTRGDSSNTEADRLTIDENGLTISEAHDILVGTTTGTKLGTTSSQKLGFWSATPIVQPTTAVAEAAFVASAGTAVNDASTFDGYTIKQVVKALRNEGLLA